MTWRLITSRSTLAKDEQPKELTIENGDHCVQYVPKNVSESEGFQETETEAFHCTACDFIFNFKRIEYDTDDYSGNATEYEHEPNYCPNCGGKIKEIKELKES